MCAVCRTAQYKITFPLSPWFFTKFCLSFLFRYSKYSSHSSSDREWTPKNHNRTDRQMAAHMYTLMYVETVMACVPCFDSKSPTEIANVNKRTGSKLVFSKLKGCLTVHLPREITLNANLMQQGNFIGVFLARHVSGTYAHHQEH